MIIDILKEKPPSEAQEVRHTNAKWNHTSSILYIHTSTVKEIISQTD